MTKAKKLMHKTLGKLKEILNVIKKSTKCLLPNLTLTQMIVDHPTVVERSFVTTSIFLYLLVGIDCLS